MKAVIASLKGLTSLSVVNSIFFNVLFCQLFRIKLSLQPLVSIKPFQTFSSAGHVFILIFFPPLSSTSDSLTSKMGCSVL